MEEILLDLKNVRKQYANFSLECSMQVKRGSITGLIGAFQIFDTIFMMIGKNTVVLENTQSVVMYFYRNAFELGNKGYACAIAMLLFVIIMFITLLQMIGQKKWVNYD